MFFQLFFLLPIFVLNACTDKTDEAAPIDDTTPNPTYTDQQLLNKVQQDAFKYFWNYAHPVSKLARERYHTDDPSNDANIVTTGGSGFGLMTIIVGIERGFVTKAEAVSRLTTALNFLENADRFHGAWPHWMNGTNGDVIPFGTVDNGGDLVETSLSDRTLSRTDRA